ncbi:hypothetical protein M2D07_006425 [Pseudomonas sp. BGr12]|uniref:hypothetical protein n=1 Tax=Pseudomonas sp. BGr12 TaxID=2936269 RepID=UPI002559AD0F|nr:hypothetical protein [Pseudomonas sp. BJa5]MDL2426653.1 hypothetical protein [Pseudomonas sp. BJa5]
MAAEEDSPNWHWHQLGYQVEHQPRPSGGNTRTVRRPDGTEVAIDQREGEHRADAEVRTALSEQYRLPHGAEECATAQLDIFHDTGEPAA